MTLRVGAAVRNFILQNGSLKNALQNGKLQIYSGSQPATPESAPSGTLLATITASGGAHTVEVPATGTITLTGGASGSIDNVTINSVDVLTGTVPFNTSLSQTAADLATALNKSMSDPEYTASASGAIVTVTAKRGLGALANGFVVASTVTTITKTDVNLAAGVTPVNGLTYDVASAGTLAKNATETWSGVAAATGTAGWFRLVGSVADSGVADSTESQIRIDGAISTSGAQLNMSSTAIASGATQTLSSFSFSLPTS
jgi:hypothetical protein